MEPRVEAAPLGQKLEPRVETEMGLALVHSRMTAVRIKLFMSPFSPSVFHCHYSVSANP